MEKWHDHSRNRQLMTYSRQDNGRLNQRRKGGKSNGAKRLTRIEFDTTRVFNFSGNFRFVKHCHWKIYLWSMVMAMDWFCADESVMMLEASSWISFSTDLNERVGTKIDLIHRSAEIFLMNSIRTNLLVHVPIRITMDWRSLMTPLKMHAEDWFLLNEAKISLWEQWLTLHQRFLIHILLHPFE